MQEKRTVFLPVVFSFARKLHQVGLDEAVYLAVHHTVHVT